jgi:hypothetical protein
MWRKFKLCKVCTLPTKHSGSSDHLLEIEFGMLPSELHVTFCQLKIRIHVLDSLDMSLNDSKLENILHQEKQIKVSKLSKGGWLIV